MNKKKLVIFVSIVFVLGICLPSVFGQEGKLKLKDKPITINFVKKPLFDVFMRLIYDYDVAIGFEQSILDSEHDDYNFQTNIPYKEPIIYAPNGTRRIMSGWRPTIDNHLISVNFKDARLEDVLNNVVKQMKNYDWEVNNDVVNIFPIHGRDPKLKKLLDIKIRAFEVSNTGEVGIIQPLIILYLPEFKSFLAENELNSYARKVGSWFDERPLKFGMKFSNLTFRELLNEITKSKRGGWILKKTKSSNIKEGEIIEIMI